MIVEYIRYSIPSEQAEIFMAAYGQASASLRTSSHCLAYELTRCSDAPDQFILRIEWDSAEGHLSGFRKSQEFCPFLQAGRHKSRWVRSTVHDRWTAVSLSATLLVCAVF